jgi:hypothetical protein
MLCKDSSKLHKGVVRGLGNDQANCNLNNLNFVNTIDVSADDLRVITWVTTICITHFCFNNNNNIAA